MTTAGYDAEPHDTAALLESLCGDLLEESDPTDPLHIGLGTYQQRAQQLAGQAQVVKHGRLTGHYEYASSVCICGARWRRGGGCVDQGTVRGAAFSFLCAVGFFGPGMRSRFWRHPDP